MILVFCAQIVMLNIWLSLTEWIGAVIALISWHGIGHPSALAARRSASLWHWPWY